MAPWQDNQKPIYELYQHASWSGLIQHTSACRPVDPSLYIHRFADRLNFGSSMRLVADTALRLVRTMKQNWLQTGRRPSGLCGAALYIAGHMHGARCSPVSLAAVRFVGCRKV